MPFTHIIELKGIWDSRISPHDVAESHGVSIDTCLVERDGTEIIEKWEHLPRIKPQSIAFSI